MSLKQEKTADYQVKQYFLEVAIHSTPEVHKKNDTLRCNSEGWNWRPEIHGQLVTIVPQRFDNLSRTAQGWIQRRAANKVTQAKP